MEFTPFQIAKLVLGYLKKEKCQAAVLAFCNASVHLKHFTETITSRKKFFITRVNGLSLLDYLTEYAMIYTLVQERLEDTDYFEEKCSKNLVDELRYLLDKRGKQNNENTPSRSRSSTPMKEQNKEHERLHFPKNLSIIEEAFHCDATPLQSLPGNSKNDTPNKVLKNTKPSLLLRSQKSDENGASDSEDARDKSLEDDDLSMQVLTQTLLEHHELHEKIAENINLVRNTADIAPVVSSDERIASGVLQELDSAIKTIVQKTEADPIFEQLIGEIIGGSVGETTDEEQADARKNAQNTEVSTKCLTVQESGLSTPELQPEECTVRQRLRSSKKQSSELRASDDQECVASNSDMGANQSRSVQSGTSTEVNKNLPINETARINVQQNLTVNTTTGEVILYDGTLDNFMKTSTTGVSHPSNSLVYNNGLLMVQPTVSTLMPAVNTLQVNSNKPCYMWNGSQLVNVSLPQLKVNNLTEQDILTMPTVIVCDDNQQGILNNLVLPANPNQQLTAPQKKFVDIAPRVDASIDKVENISEFLTLYQCNDSNESCAPQKIQDLKQPRAKSKKIIRKGTQKSATLPAVRIEVLKPAEMEEIKVETESHSSTSPRYESKQAIEVESNAEKVTPELVKKNNERHRNLSTPKSGSLSHVRALDFNFGTPGKLIKEKASPKSLKKSPKITTSKISKSLFGTPTRTEKSEREKTVDVVDMREDAAENSGAAEIATKDAIKKATNSWDSDLRALTGPISDRCPTPKRKRKDSLRNRKCAKRTKIDGREQTQPNTSTESTDKSGDSLKKPKGKLKRKPKTSVKDANNTKSKSPQNTEKPDAAIKVEEGDVKTENAVVEMTEAAADVNSTKECETNEITLGSDMPFSLINCNAKARYKRKCNIDNNLKKEVKITKVKEIKSLEFVNDSGSNKLILSPSKLNANKRSLVEIDEKDTKLQCTIEDQSKKLTNDIEVQLKNQTTAEEKPSKINTLNNKADLINSTSSGQTVSKFITPEMQKEPLIQHPVISKRNITPILETPMKMLMSQCPKTPGLLSPVHNTDTPFTKVFKEQLHGVDISCIQTPKFLLTPNFPFTPTPDGVSPYPVRPSDYSTSSSYYQPSDAEQNKSLEQLMIDECKRLENKKDTPVKINAKDEVVMEMQKVIGDDQKEVSEAEQDLTNKAIVEKMKSLSSNIIARKNLSLMDKANIQSGDSSCNSSSSESASDTSSSDSESNIGMWNSCNNETVVQKGKSEMIKSSRYNLRSRRGDVEVKHKEISVANVDADREIIQQIIAEVDIKSTLESNAKVCQTLSNRQEKVLQEMEQKRQRMIAKLKDDQNVKVAATTAGNKKRKLKCDEKHTLPARLPNGRFSNVTGMQKSSVKKPVNRRKSNLPKKILPTVSDTNAVETSVIPANTEETEGVRFHLSSDSECTKLEPFDLVETELRESSTSSTPLPLGKIPESHPLKNFHIVLETITSNQNEKNKESTSDQEAECLVKGLKEWGIHLVHNKSPKKQDKDNQDKIESCEVKQNDKSEETSKSEVGKDLKNVACENWLQVIHESENLQKERSEVVNNTEIINLEANHKKDDTINNTDQISVERDKTQCANESLEEGEILSEGECGKTEASKPKPKYKESHRKDPHIRRRDYVEKRSSKQYKSEPSSRRKYPSKSSRSKVTDKARGAPTKSKSEPNRTSTTSKAKNKSEAAAPKKIASTEKIPPEITSVNKILEDLNLSNSLSELTFDIKLFPEDNLHIVYDESKARNKDIRQYNSELLNKRISAKVYIESIDAEIDKFMTVTPFEFILDIPERCKSTEPKVKILDCVTLRTKRDAKLKSISENDINLSTVSPLDNLYEPQASRGYGARVAKCNKTVAHALTGRRKSVDQDTKNRKSTASVRHSRSKSVDQKMLLTEVSLGLAEGKRAATKQTDKDKLGCTDTKISQNVEKKSAAGSSKDGGKQCLDVKNSCSESQVSVDVPSDKKIEVSADADGGKIAEIIKSVADENATTAENINDDLMNYAICGSERAENVEDSNNKESANKTSADSDKLHNCHELLSKLNVDVFLNKLHGE